MAARTWTKEQRESQRQKIQQWKPWQSSTGPKSAEGKAASSKNALVHGLRSADVSDIEQVLAEAMAMLERLKKK